MHGARCSMLAPVASAHSGWGASRRKKKSEDVETARLTCVTASMGKPILRRTEARNLPYFVPHRRYMNQSPRARCCSTGNLRSSSGIKSND
jgi:hypothetical protein